MKNPLIYILSLIIFLFLCPIAKSQFPEFVWAKQADGDLGDAHCVIAVDSQGNCIIGGIFLKEFSFDKLTFTSEQGASYLIKCNRSGVAVWGKKLTVVVLADIAVDRFDNIIVTGFFRDKLVFPEITLSSSGESDVFIAKFDSNGNLLWARTGGGAGLDMARAIATDLQGGYIITGEIDQTATFDGIELSSVKNNCVFIAKYEKNGDIVWVKTAKASKSAGVTAVEDGFAIAGSFTDEGVFGSKKVTSSRGGSTIFVARYNGDGDAVWVRGLERQRYCYSHDLAADANGNLYLSGGNLGDGVLVAKYDSNGILKWDKIFGSDGFEWGTGICTDVNGQLPGNRVSGRRCCVQ